MAAADITAIITGRPRPMPRPPGEGSGPPGAPTAAPAAAPAAVPPPAAYPSSGPGWACLYPGCEGAPPEFDLPGRLRGPQGSYLQHIQSATGAAGRVTGRGSGAAPEASPEPPLHLRLECGDPAQLEEACQ